MSRPDVARLLFPALRADEDGGFDGSRPFMDEALRLGVGGFILFGGTAERVHGLTDELRRRASTPLLIGADLERGAGQQFRGATRLPPAAALAAVDDPDATRRAAELTAREARALGIDWVYAPVADVDVEPRNPIVGTRAFGTDPETVTRHVVAWIEGCRAGGALSCAKHFPGHGRTVADSHMELPRVEADGDALEVDMHPFRAAVRAGVDSVMTAHVAYPALDPTDVPATLSSAIISGLLRERVGFDGLVVTDALIMEGVLSGGTAEGAAAVAAVGAGCDALLYPREIGDVATALGRAIETGGLSVERVRRAVGRVEAAAEGRGVASDSGAWGAAADREWALELAGRSLRVERGRPRVAGRSPDLVIVDDDEGGPSSPPSRDPFPRRLRAANIDVAVRAADDVVADRPAVIAVFADIRGWKGRPGLSERARTAVRTAVETRPDATVVLFGHPRLAEEAPGENVLVAWGGEAVMQEAAARWLAEAEPGDPAAASDGMGGG